MKMYRIKPSLVEVPDQVLKKEDEVIF